MFKSFLANDLKLAILPAILGFALYLPSIQFSYALDDHLIITENEFVQQGISGIGDLMTHNYADGGKNFNDGLYRPLTPVTFAIEKSLFGEHKAGFSHFVNALGYGLLIYFLVLFLIKLKLARLAILLTAVFFAVHPVHTEVVSNIKGRDDLFSLLFGVLFGLSFLKALMGNKNHYIIGGLFLILALFSKETSVTYFLLFPLLVYSLNEISFKKLLIGVGPFFIITLGFYMLRTSVIGSMAGPPDPGLHSLLSNPIAASDSMLEQMGTAFKMQGMYLIKMLFPAYLVHDYSYNLIPLSTLGSWKAIAGLLLFLSMAFLTIYQGIIKRKLWALALGFYLGTLFITSNIIIHIGALFAERFVFIPSLGFAIVVGIAIHNLFKKQRNINVSIILALAVIGSVLSLKRSADWKDNITLFSIDLKKAAESARVNYNYGSEVIKVAREKHEQANGHHWQKAEMAYLKALEIYPDYYDALNNLGNAYSHIADYQKAEFYLKKLVEINPRYGKGWYNLAFAYHKWGKHQACINAFKAYCKMLPNNPDVWYLMGKSAGSLNKFSEAEGYLKRAVALKPSEAEFRQFLAMAYAFQKKFELAENEFLTVLRQSPKNAEALRNLSGMYLNSQQYAKAKRYLKQAINYYPQDASFQNMLSEIPTNLK